MSLLLSSAREIVSRAVDNIFRSADIRTTLSNDIYTDAMLDVVDQQRLFTLKHWNCFISCLHLLSYLKEHYNGFYGRLIPNDDDYAIMDCFVSLYHSNNNIFR